ncbi:MAG: hypothetical protein JWL87_272 [Candidatus Adlerbacteria bacterium]|nr:hypothetical protein [Candidatus Adlerbacteria bacterium]
MLYAAFVRLPTEKAHGAQIVRTCEALARQGMAVVLAIPGRKTSIAQDVFEYYGAERTFAVVSLPVADLVGLGRIGFLWSSLLFACRISRRAKAQGSDCIYSRDKTVLVALNLLSRVPLVWEIHGSEPLWALRILSRAKFVAITAGIRDDLVARGVPPQSICVAHDGIDLDSFADTEPQGVARSRLGIPLGRKTVMYIGRLDGWKGTGTLLEASELLPDDVQVAIIGGEQEQVKWLRSRYPHVLFLGFLPYRDIARNEAAADVLVLPNTAKDITSLKYTSPLKLFAYMASGVPMVVSDLPSLREIISEKEAFLIEPDNAQTLAGAIMAALKAPDAQERARRAKERVAEYTWDKRAERIVKHVSHV